MDPLAPFDDDAAAEAGVDAPDQGIDASVYGDAAPVILTRG